MQAGDGDLGPEFIEVMRDLADDGQNKIVVTHKVRFARSATGQVLFVDGGP